jgi:putative ABC transport system permease protein
MDQRMLLEIALRNLRRHWVRSLLAMVGIIIGVIAIASLGILGNSIAILLGGLVSDVSDTILVTPHLAVSSGDPFDPRNTLPSTLTERDISEIRKASGQNRVIPMIRTSEQVTVGDRTGFALLYALESDDIPFLLDLEAGLYPKGSAPGILMGTLLAEDFEVTTGKKVDLGNASVRIVGIPAERGMGIDINPDYAVIVTQEWYARSYGEENYNQVVIKVRDIGEIDEVKEAIDQQLNRRKTRVDIRDSKEILEIYVQTLDAINVLLIGIGAVSLFVASVSILNVMIISVTERTREIGVVRSIGTRRRAVMVMFLYEALVLGIGGSLIGGVISAGVGYAISVAVAEFGFAGFTPSAELSVFDPAVAGYIIFGMAFGIATSVIAGVYPAWKAASLKPIEALHYE